jgi:hypothetical protein
MSQADLSVTQGTLVANENNNTIACLRKIV